MDTEFVNYVVAEGLSLDVHVDIDSTFQTLPGYDETENVLVIWDDDQPLYFVSFLKLPKGWQVPDVWMSGFLNEIKILSENREIEVLNQDSFSAKDGYEVHFIEIKYQLNHEEKVNHQVVSFITNGEESYSSYATPLTLEKPIEMLEEIQIIFRSASLPSSNIVPLVRRAEDRFSGLWSGTFTSGELSFTVMLRLIGDFTFSCREADSKKSFSFSGGWSTDGETLYLHHLYGMLSNNRTLNILHFAHIEEFTGASMTLSVSNTKDKIQLYRESN